jgi:hypothetical protein
VCAKRIKKELNTLDEDDFVGDVHKLLGKISGLMGIRRVFGNDRAISKNERQALKDFSSVIIVKG